MGCSLICNGTFGSQAFGIIKYFAKTSKVLSNILCGDWKIFIFLAFLQIYVVLTFLLVVVPLMEGRFEGGAIVTELHISSSNRFEFREYLYCILGSS